MRSLIIFILSFFIGHTQAKVEPKNYNFSLDQLRPYYPGSVFPPANLKEKPESLGKKGEMQLFRINIVHIRYKFPLIVQVKDGKILDFYARLPSYFLHDVFHQSLINRYGKQDSYFKLEENAVYIWKNKEGVKLVYSGTCTITCFPIFLTGMPAVKDEKGGGNFIPLLEQMAKKSSKF